MGSAGFDTHRTDILRSQLDREVIRHDIGLYGQLIAFLRLDCTREHILGIEVHLLHSGSDGNNGLTLFLSDHDSARSGGGQLLTILCAESGGLIVDSADR